MDIKEKLTNIINKPFNVICHTDDGITASDIIDSLSLAREQIKELEAELQELANQMMERYESWDEPEKGTLLGWHQRIERALKR